MCARQPAVGAPRRFVAGVGRAAAGIAGGVHRSERARSLTAASRDFLARQPAGSADPVVIFASTQPGNSR
jgi:hypothetical protein